MKSSRKYTVNSSIPTSPLARDSTAVVPLRLKKKDSFSTAHHTHGLGGEAKDAMLRSGGLRMRRTNSSLRIIATKGNATLTAAFTHKVFVPELEIFLKNYARKEDEFAESIPSAMSPFQFIQNDTSDIVPSLQRKSSNADVKAESDPQQMREWLKEMRLKVHMRLVQRQQVTNVANPTESHKLADKTNVASAATPKGVDSARKKTTSGHDSERKKGGDTERKRGNESERKKQESDRKKGSESERKKQESDRKKKGDVYDAIEEAVPLPRSSTETRISSGHSVAGETSSGSSTLKSPKQQQKDFPPSRKTGTRSSKMPQSNKSAATAAQQQGGPLDGNTPLFQARKNPTLTRRTHSEYDVRRVRIKARNSVGFEPAW